MKIEDAEALEIAVLPRESDPPPPKSDEERSPQVVQASLKHHREDLVDAIEELQITLRDELDVKKQADKLIDFVRSRPAPFIAAGALLFVGYLFGRRSRRHYY